MNPYGSTLRLEEIFSDRGPLGGKRLARHRALRASVPVPSIVQIALHAMQIGVYPGALLATLVHDDVVRPLPIVLAGPPQRHQRRPEAGGRLGALERLLAMVEGDRATSVDLPF